MTPRVSRRQFMHAMLATTLTAGGTSLISGCNQPPPAQGTWIANHIPGARRHLVEGEGHLSVAVKHFEQILDALLGQTLITFRAAVQDLQSRQLRPR